MRSGRIKTRKTPRAINILAIETSCDETALAIVACSGTLGHPKFKIKKHVIASQIKHHQPFGGVVPSIAKREHQINLPRLLEKMGSESYLKKNIDYIAVTAGPGLEPALWAGITFAQELAKKIKKPLGGANHLEGHLYSFLLPAKKTRLPQKMDSLFPMVGLLVSGGHTMLVEIKDLKKRKVLGETRDDAVGEAFDKVARLLELPYPGGPEIEKIAAAGNGDAVPFPRPMINSSDLEFSFSGLKTSVLYFVQKLKENPEMEKNTTTADIAASFQKAAIETLVSKTGKAVRQTKARSVILCGGVAANKALRTALAQLAKKTEAKFFVPEFVYNTDNAAMIGAASYLNILKKKKVPLRANGNLSI